MRYAPILLLFLLCSCGSRPGKTTAKPQTGPPAAQTPQPAPRQTGAATAEDTVRHQLGGKLFFSEWSKFNPADSITVIETRYHKAEGKELYREYRFITHNRYSFAHRFFESSYLDSVYMSYFDGPDYREFYEHQLPDSLKSEYIDPAIGDFNGYWVYLAEYNGDYYLDDDWSWHISFHIADSVKSELYMDGPVPRKIRTATALPQGGLLLRFHRADPLRSYKDDSLRIEAVDARRGVYRLSGENDYFTAPARAVHNFEIIQYCNSTGDLI
uniref:hypothetical protein n=1 Tax=Alistipes sp. D31t1_170403_E11 TaxID=2787128 RepID=UPI00189A83EE|nr:hypothetical protein [Alistipes sp. D31t1_170403_E11]